MEKVSFGTKQNPIVDMSHDQLIKEKFSASFTLISAKKKRGIN